ncbi:MAG: DUF790 family protein [Verrucomicrobiota bacterium]|nr:DUF790 family protein [Verrucomicrobiota bacterium]
MLTKNLIRYRLDEKYIKPLFIDTENENLYNLAANLLGCYNVKKGYTRSEINEETSYIINAFPEPLIAKGLNKLICDKTEFETPQQIDYCAVRKKIFAESANFFKKGLSQKLSPEEFREKIALKCFLDKGVADSLYSDLPDYEKLVKIKEFFPKELLCIYNCSLVQSLLLYADDLQVKVSDADSAKLRKLFKYLKFFRLLAQIKKVKLPKKSTSELNIKIDGPASIFENPRKYGLQLASFFPAICGLDKWKLQTEVSFKGKHILSLNEKTGLVSHYKHFSAYIPEEIRIFHKLFKEKANDWQIIGDTPFINIEKQEIIFPDLCFQHCDSKQTVNLELFHRWHRYGLEKHIKYLRKTDSLIIGVDRHLYKNCRIKEILDDSGLLNEKIFLFRDFPGIRSVKSLLEITCKSTKNN